ncbi:hypothetical protein GCM10023215_32290 [Pseudonocardia yuanmonensis]|uniref:Uncharacterized protein n=1 Tax=Pseudonocardia yuanmonensis TaxID=1095914 RepID=A0ABP8WR27_9PSEU
MLEQISATTTQQVTSGLPPGRSGYTVTANALVWRLDAADVSALPTDQVRGLLAEWLRAADWPRAHAALIVKAVTEAVRVLQQCRGPLPPTSGTGGLRIETMALHDDRTRRLRIVVADGGAGAGTGVDRAGPDLAPLRELVDEVAVGPDAVITMLTRVVPKW